MRNRRKARELAMQALFYMDMSQNDSKEAIKLFCENFVTSKRNLPFFLELINGVIKALPEIDSVIERFSSNWKISRMSIVDRNIMRLAVYEMLFCGDIPSKVSINEAIDIGKKFGAEESGAFINGILDSIRIALEEEKSIQALTNNTD
ncbi:MAG: transcription antitermination factor NusB [Desulfobacterales bacterium]|jgi:N utilization substance protein B|nr:transcription antitermination factor NusB [Desulfobacterales bacterium]